jgi:hypothetical protein
MLAGALGRLFLDLDKVPESERSPYESALHRELVEIAQRLQPLPSQQNFGSWSLRQAIESSPALRVQVDLDLDGSDVTRLRCSKPDCPNKRAQ